MQVVTKITLEASQHTANHHQENHYQPNIHNNYAIQECTFVQKCLEVNLGATCFLERLEANQSRSTRCNTLHHTEPHCFTKSAPQCFTRKTSSHPRSTPGLRASVFGFQKGGQTQTAKKNLAQKTSFVLA